MSVTEVVGVLGFVLGIVNLWFTYKARQDRLAREKLLDDREAAQEAKEAAAANRSALKEKYARLFAANVGVATWQERTVQAQEEGLSEEEILELWEPIWMDYFSQRLESVENRRVKARLTLKLARQK